LQGRSWGIYRRGANDFAVAPDGSHSQFKSKSRASCHDDIADVVHCGASPSHHRRPVLDTGLGSRLPVSAPALAGCRLFQMPGISGVMPSGNMQEQPNPVSSTGRRGWEGLPAIDGQRCKIEVQACLRKDNHPQKALRRPVLNTGLGFPSTFRLGMMLDLPTLREQGSRQAKGGNRTK